MYLPNASHKTHYFLANLINSSYAHEIIYIGHGLFCSRTIPTHILQNNDTMEFYDLKAQQNNQNKQNYKSVSYVTFQRGIPPSLHLLVNSFMHNMILKKETNKCVVTLKSPTGTHEQGVASQWLVLCVMTIHLSGW